MKYPSNKSAYKASEDYTNFNDTLKMFLHLNSGKPSVYRGFYVWTERLMFNQSIRGGCEDEGLRTNTAWLSLMPLGFQAVEELIEEIQRLRFTVCLSWDKIPGRKMIVDYILTESNPNAEVGKKILEVLDNECKRLEEEGKVLYQRLCYEARKKFDSDLILHRITPETIDAVSN